jgi:hypothetical protein
VTGAAQVRPAPAEAVRAELEAWVTEALMLRRRSADRFPGAGATPPQVHEALLATRADLDRVEELLGAAMMLRGGARRWSVQEAAAESDAFDETSARLRRQGRRDDWSTGRERQADVSLLILERRQAARGAQRFRDECEDMLERIRLAHDGLKGTCRDLAASLGYFRWESSLGG